MPIYEYKCERDGTFEEWQSFSDAPLTACPKCGSPVERVFSTGVGLVFKGSGWYITDYQRAGQAEWKESKAETKPEAKPDAKAQPPAPGTAGEGGGPTSPASSPPPSAGSAGGGATK